MELFIVRYLKRNDKIIKAEFNKILIEKFNCDESLIKKCLEDLINKVYILLKDDYYQYIV